MSSAQSKFEAFNQYFETHCRGSRQRDAFEKASDDFEKKAGFRPYGSFESYKNQRSKNFRRKMRK